MLLEDAQRRLSRLLDPLPCDVFLDQCLGRRFVHVPASAGAARGGLLGADPRACILANHARISHAIGHHALAPTGPPPDLEPALDARAFAAKIEAFHARGYTVRIPDVRRLSNELELTLRALEALFHQRASAEAFWSRGDARAPVHHDDYDLLAIQLIGRKRWRIETGPSSLANPWKTIPDKPAAHEDPTEIVVAPGDLLYLPRGTTHSVDALSESLHVSIGFTPLTLREALIACADYLSDLARPMRETVGARLGEQVRLNDFGALPDLVTAAAAHLAGACAREGFVAEALQRRSSRVIGELAGLAAAAEKPDLSPRSRVRRNPLAISHLSANATKIDFAFPGGHHYVHSGAQEAVAFLAGAREFAVAEVPGDIDDDVRIALVGKLLDAGVFEVVDAEARR